MNYFKECQSLEELKKEYKKLVFMYHPDRPTGNLAIMQDINNQYDNIFPILKTMHNTKAEAKEKGFYATSETVEMFKDIIAKIINLQGLTMEICGSWLWVSGNTKPNRKALSAAGLHYSKKKAMWYWRADRYKSKNRGKMTIDDIRNKYGSDTVGQKICMK